MAKFIEKERKEIEAITFPELVEIGKNIPGVVLVNGMAQNFKFKDHEVTHENDHCYLVEVIKDNGGLLPFTPDDMLIINSEEDQIIPYNKVKFNEIYEAI
jgi:hypothetical protein